jgi:hypothetical protein
MIILTLQAVDWLECEIDGLSQYEVADNFTVGETKNIISREFPSLLEQDPHDSLRVEVSLYIPAFRRVPLHDRMLLATIGCRYYSEQRDSVFLCAILVRRTTRRVVA